MIYFVREGNRVKIGYSSKPAGRLATLRTATANDHVVLGVMAGDKAQEAELHRRFRHLHVRREWFDLTNEVVAFIENNCRPYLSGIGRVTKDFGAIAMRDLKIGAALAVPPAVLGWCMQLKLLHASGPAEAAFFGSILACAFFMSRGCARLDRARIVHGETA